MPGQITPDDRAGATDATETMDINGFTIFNMMIYPVQNTDHVDTGRDAHIFYGQSIK